MKKVLDPAGQKSTDPTESGSSALDIGDKAGYPTGYHGVFWLSANER